MFLRRTRRVRGRQARQAERIGANGERNDKDNGRSMVIRAINAPSSGLLGSLDQARNVVTEAWWSNSVLG